MQKFTNGARAILASTINNTDTTLTIESGGSLFPVANTGTSAISNSADWFKLVLQDTTGIEIIYVRTHTSGSTTFSNILRGQEGTTAREFLAGSTVGLRETAADAEGWGSLQAQVDAKAPAASPTLTGAIALSGSSRSNTVAVSASDIDCSAGNSFTKTISANTTFTFSNAPSGVTYGFVFELTHTSGTVTWPTSVKWPNDAAPSLTAGKTHVFTFITDDGGTRWRGSCLPNYVN